MIQQMIMKDEKEKKHRGSKRMIKCGEGKQIKYVQGKLEEKNYDADEKENMDDKR